MADVTKRSYFTHGFSLHGEGCDRKVHVTVRQETDRETRKPRIRYSSKDTPLVTYFFKLGPTFSNF